MMFTSKALLNTSRCLVVLISRYGIASAYCCVVKLVTFDPVLRGVTEMGEGSRGLTADLRLNCSSRGLVSLGLVTLGLVTLGVVSVVESRVLKVPSLLQPDYEAFIPTWWDT
ncbi:hypothetical protein ElyMa_006088000 [Elysia marginata]|uniref:Uncharacterized protein n=1 Tax=Elysia marginata TaxID=1093978 RepID=A0AAV4GRX0_9GAST|nr:hypothetical protein ElyMa_006088000 [Elysia marginata]